MEAHYPGFTGISVGISRGELVVAYETNMRRRSASGAWGPYVLWSGGAHGPVAVDSFGALWGGNFGGDEGHLVRVESDDTVTAYEVAARPQVAATPDGSFAAAWPDGLAVGWGTRDGSGIRQHRSAPTAHRVLHAIPAPVDGATGHVLYASEDQSLTAIHYTGAAVDGVMTVARRFGLAGRRPFSAVAFGSRLYVAYSTELDPRVAQRIVVAAVAEGRVTEWSLDTQGFAREAVLVGHRDGTLDALWVAGAYAPGRPPRSMLRAARYNGFGWTAPVDLGAVEYDLMLPPFDAAAAGAGDLVVAYQSPSGMVSRRRTSDTWQAPTVLAPPRAYTADIDVAGHPDGRAFIGYTGGEDGLTRLVVHCVE